MTPPSIGLFVAFGAGLLSFLSPCGLPLIPSYITFITGLSFDDVTSRKRVALVHGLLFVLGFSLIFLALGATATVLGRVMFAQRWRLLPARNGSRSWRNAWKRFSGLSARKMTDE